MRLDSVCAAPIGRPELVGDPKWHTFDGMAAKRLRGGLLAILMAIALTGCRTTATVEAVDTSKTVDTTNTTVGFTGDLPEPNCAAVVPQLDFDVEAPAIADPNERSVADLNLAVESLGVLQTGAVQSALAPATSGEYGQISSAYTWMWDAESQVGVLVGCERFANGVADEDEYTTRNIYIGDSSYALGPDALDRLIPASEITSVNDALVSVDGSSTPEKDMLYALRNGSTVELSSMTVLSAEYIGTAEGLALYRIETEYRQFVDSSLLGLEQGGSARLIIPHIGSGIDAMNIVRISPETDSAMLSDLGNRRRLTLDEAIGELNANQPEGISIPDLDLASSTLVQAPELSVTNVETAVDYLATDQRVIDRINDRERFSWDYSEVWPAATGSKRMAQLVDNYIDNIPTDDEPSDYGWVLGLSFALTLEQIEPSVCIRNGDLGVQTSLSQNAIDAYIDGLQDLPRYSELAEAGFTVEEFALESQGRLPDKPWTEITYFFNTCSRYADDLGRDPFGWLQRYKTLIYLNTVADGDGTPVNRFAASTEDPQGRAPLVLGFDSQGRLVLIEQEGAASKAPFKNLDASTHTEIAYELADGSLDLPPRNEID